MADVVQRNQFLENYKKQEQKNQLIKELKGSNYTNDSINKSFSGGQHSCSTYSNNINNNTLNIEQYYDYKKLSDGNRSILNQSTNVTNSCVEEWSTMKSGFGKNPKNVVKASSKAKRNGELSM